MVLDDVLSRYGRNVKKKNRTVAFLYESVWCPMVVSVNSLFGCVCVQYYVVGSWQKGAEIVYLGPIVSYERRRDGQLCETSWPGSWLRCGGVTLVLSGHRSKTVTQRSQIKFSILKTCILVFKKKRWRMKSEASDCRCGDSFLLFKLQKQILLASESLEHFRSFQKIRCRFESDRKVEISCEERRNPSWMSAAAEVCPPSKHLKTTANLLVCSF